MRKLRCTGAEKLQQAGVQTQEALDNATHRQRGSLRTPKLSSPNSRWLPPNPVLALPSKRWTIARFARICRNCRFARTSVLAKMVSPISRRPADLHRTGIATIVDMKSNEIEVDVNESYIAPRRKRATGHRDAGRLSGQADSFEGSHGYPTADRQKATVKVRITILNLENTFHSAGHGREGGVFGE